MMLRSFIRDAEANLEMSSHSQGLRLSRITCVTGLTVLQGQLDWYSSLQLDLALHQKLWAFYTTYLLSYQSCLWDRR